MARATQEPVHDTELLTYVTEGALTCFDADGGTEALRAGEFQVVATSAGVRREVWNTSSRYEVSYLQVQIQLGPTPTQPGLTESIAEGQRKRFYRADRHHRLCLVASRSGRLDSLALAQDVDVHSAVLDGGDHVVFELAQQRMAWLHVVRGTVLLRGVDALHAGDGASIVAELSVSFRATSDSEVLLIDVPDGATTSQPDATSSRAAFEALRAQSSTAIAQLPKEPS